MPRPSLLPLFTQVRGIRILRTSPFGDSRKFSECAANDILFIGGSAILISSILPLC